MHKTLSLLACLAFGFSVNVDCLADEKAPSPGYTLLAPLGNNNAYLVNLDGDVVHQWNCDNQPGNATYLLEDGSLLRTGKVENETFQSRGGAGGKVQKYTWDGDLVWDYTISNDQMYQHHDVEPMPNGNVLVIAWEYRSRDEAIAAGRDPDLITDNALWPETIVEIKQDGINGAQVVWQWSLWDHLVQSHDDTKDNFGNTADHPELVDLNFARNGGADWIHMNSVAYNAELDQIALSARWFNEVWIIDHSTTTEEAASHSGGKHGKGGDLIYRWGNPYAYFAGLPSDQIFFGQHDARWIPKSYPGAGNMTVFNNGGERAGRDHSSADEFKPVINKDGTYPLPAIGPYQPQALTWTYADPERFLSERISGVERQPNGNTLICQGDSGRVFEVTPEGEIVWDKNAGDLIPSQGPRGGSLFRAPRYTPDYPAFQGKSLTPRNQ
tara:strand:- start:48855 stop:50174 length:1320 start_codon:yes stop_codon:yes gene_type:complete